MLNASPPAREQTGHDRGAYARSVYSAGAEARNRDLIDDVEWILSSQEPIAVVTHRLGYKPDSLARRLARAGRADLARPFWRLDHQRRDQKVA